MATSTCCTTRSLRPPSTPLVQRVSVRSVKVLRELLGCDDRPTVEEIASASCHLAAPRDTFGTWQHVVAIRRSRALVSLPGVRFYLEGALDVGTGELLTMGGERKSVSLFCELLTAIANRYPRARRVHLILDNYVIRSATVTQQHLAALNGRIVLHLLPPYCPDANRIERVWQDLHANVTRYHRCKSMPQLLHSAKRYLDGYVWRHVTGLRVLTSCLILFDIYDR